MSDYINEDASYFEGFDFENVELVLSKVIADLKSQVNTRSVAQEQIKNVYSGSLNGVLPIVGRSDKLDGW